MGVSPAMSISMVMGLVMSDFQWPSAGLTKAILVRFDSKVHVYFRSIRILSGGSRRGEEGEEGDDVSVSVKCHIGDVEEFEGGVEFDELVRSEGEGDGGDGVKSDVGHDVFPSV